MEQKEQSANYPGVVDQKEVDSLNNILKELNIEETNSPSAPKKPMKTIRFQSITKFSAPSFPSRLI